MQGCYRPRTVAEKIGIRSCARAHLRTVRGHWKAGENVPRNGGYFVPQRSLSGMMRLIGKEARVALPAHAVELGSLSISSATGQIGVHVFCDTWYGSYTGRFRSSSREKRLHVGA